jgi:hypothetical protein
VNRFLGTWHLSVLLLHDLEDSRNLKIRLFEALMRLAGTAVTTKLRTLMVSTFVLINIRVAVI